jgi:thiol-disulfide isomerase/thioredoxin
MKVVKIGATWCNGCIVMKPRWEKIEEENPWLETEYYDFDQHPEIVRSYGVTEGVLPVFIFLSKDGIQLERLQGEPSKEKILEVIEKYKDK